MHLAFLSPFDLADPLSYSGTTWHMLNALRAHVDRVSLVGPLPTGGRVVERAKRLRHRLRGENYLRDHTERAVRAMAAAAEPRLRALRPDVVLSPSTLPLAYLDVPFPTACWSDATFEANLQFYPDYNLLPDAHVLEAHRVERAALERATRALFATAHAARSATGYYGIDPAKVRVALYGGNLNPEPEAEWVDRHVAARPVERCRLLFLGMEWVRKGGDVAVRVADELNARGLPTELAVVGMAAALDRPRPYVHSLGFLRPSVPAERVQLYELLATSHFLCMPVRAEDFGCVFAEAAAFGLPSLTTAVGGMPSTVVDGEGGLLFPYQAQPQEIAERALALLREPGAYGALCRSARARYEAHLNWPAAAGRVVELLRELA